MREELENMNRDIFIFDGIYGEKFLTRNSRYGWINSQNICLLCTGKGYQSFYDT